MVGLSKLFWPCSTTRIDRLGSASARRPATMQAAVPPPARITSYSRPSSKLLMMPLSRVSRFLLVDDVAKLLSRAGLKVAIESTPERNPGSYDTGMARPVYLKIFHPLIRLAILRGNTLAFQYRGGGTSRTRSMRGLIMPMRMKPRLRTALPQSGLASQQEVCTIRW